MTGHRLLLSFERASTTTLEFNASARQCGPLRPPGEITVLERWGDYGQVRGKMCV